MNMQHITLSPVEAVSITILVDNLTDYLVRDQGPAKRPGSSGRPPMIASPFIDGDTMFDALLAEHGFSALVTVVRDGRSHRILFDAGVTQDGLVENMRRLSISPKDIETIVLSHGHFDHVMGLHGLVRELGGRANLPVLIHPEFWNRRRVVIPGQEPLPVFSSSKAALRGAGFDIVEERRPSFLLDGSVLVTGEVDRTTEFEQGLPGHQALRDGTWQPDPLILDDQALLLNVRDKGLVVLTGCGHSGIVNIVRYARKLTGIERVYAVIGGFHLPGPPTDLTRQTSRSLAAFSPTVIVPTHCTGFPAMATLAAEMPDAFIQSTVGTHFEL
jgi:7,8-dihydropterin-6-yl-methyl-4-(beta-D-ribofuranosyl)aminobenzene 5'-phosphate synthase